jgi:hypothetical protein
MRIESEQEIDQQESEHDEGIPNDLDEAQKTILQPGETLRIFHPHSKRSKSAVLTPSINNRPGTTPIRTKEHENAHLPFRTRAEFQQAEIFGDYNVTNLQIDRQLQLLHSMGCGGEIPMANSRDYHRLLEDGAFFEDLGEVSFHLVTCFNMTYTS